MELEVLGLSRRRLVSKVDPLHAGNIHISIFDHAGKEIAAISLPANHAYLHADNCIELAKEISPHEVPALVWPVLDVAA